MEEFGFFIIVLSLGSLFGWLTKSLGYSEVIGYILGGLVVGFSFYSFGFDYSVFLPYFGLLKELGVILLFFTAGLSIGYDLFKRKLVVNVAGILPSYLIIWSFTSLLSIAMGFDQRIKLLIILISINSSTAAIVSLLKRKNGELIKNTILLSNLEDIMQFIVFSIMIAIIQAEFKLSNALIMLLKVSGSIFLLLGLAKLILGLTKQTRIFVDKESFFFMSIVLALWYSFITGWIGLPPLLGAFIAGIAASGYTDNYKIHDMISGLRELGLVVYFALIGSDIAAIMVGRLSTQTIMLGIFIGIFTTMLRGAGIFVGQLLVGKTISEALMISGLLTPISETGLVLVIELIKSGFLTEDYKVIVTLQLITSLLIGGFLTRKTENIVEKIVVRLPTNIYKYLNSISRIYLYNVDIATKIIGIIAKYTLVLIIINVFSTEVAILAREINVYLHATIGIIVLMILLLLLSFTQRALIKEVSSRLIEQEKRKTLGAEVIIPIILGALTLLLQMQIALETISEMYGDTQKVITHTFIISYVAVMMITIIEILKLTKKRLSTS